MLESYNQGVCQNSGIVQTFIHAKISMFNIYSSLQLSQ